MMSGAIPEGTPLQEGGLVRWKGQLGVLMFDPKLPYSMMRIDKLWLANGTCSPALLAADRDDIVAASAAEEEAAAAWTAGARLLDASRFALHRAADSGQTKLVQQMLATPEWKALIDAKSTNGGNTALHAAAQNGRIHCVQALLSAEADPGLTQADWVSSEGGQDGACHRGGARPRRRGWDSGGRSRSAVWGRRGRRGQAERAVQR
eukprot:COSAG01_NODE_9997_length_2279_cov_1.643283_1_plen_206_part_00